MSLPLGIIALGLVQGALAGINSLGIVLLWRTTRIINLAQPALGLVGGVLTGMLVVSAGWAFWWAAPIGLFVGAGLGLLTERVILTRLHDVPRAVLLVATVGLAQIFGAIQAGLPFIFGGALPTYTINLGVTVDVFPVRLLGPHLMALAALPVTLAGLWWFLHRSRIGLAACALGQDVERARALGVPAAAVRAGVWAVAGAVATLAGILSIPVLGFSLGGGLAPTVLLLAIAPAVLAGLRNLFVTAGAALALGVAYQAFLYNSSSAGTADLVLAGAMLAAVALQRRRLARADAAARASSWEAAATPRPLPWAAAQAPVVRLVGHALAVLAVVAVALPPVWLSPSQDVLYATSAALALGAVAVAVAWMFAGEVALGHWGLAGLGAAVAAIAPGGWFARSLIAGVLMAALGALMAITARHRSTLSFAVLSLAAAAAAPVAVLSAGKHTVPADPGQVGVIAAGVAMMAALGVGVLRTWRLGRQMVAARDDPQRAPWLGVDPLRSRVIALAITGGLAGMAGAFYLASTPAGIAPGAFDPQRSLDLLAMAVVGGLGSPIGALIGVGAMQAGRQFLTGPWSLLVTGSGVLVVVIFLPAGVSKLLELIRDKVVGWLAPTAIIPPTRVLRAADDAPIISASPSERGGARIAGSDTREVMQTVAVRRAAGAVAMASAPGWAAALGAAAAWKRYVAMPSTAGPWFITAIVAASVAAGIVGWRRALAKAGQGGVESSDALPTEVLGAGSAIVIAALALTAAITGDNTFAALALPVVAVLAGWIVGQAAQVATSAVMPAVAPAVGGVLTTSAGLGLIGALHLSLVSGGSGIGRAGVWAAVYAAAAAWLLTKARLAAAADRRRGVERVIELDAVEHTTTAPAGPPPGVVTLGLESITAGFGSSTIVANATLHAARGEMLALVGGNGAGKSTLLRVAAGFVPVTSGRVMLAGEDVTTLRPEERAALGMAFVSGARPVFPDLTVVENLRVAAFDTHRTLKGFARATEAVLDLVPALAGRDHDLVGVLSGGQQRLLAVAQTLYRRPSVLLADELTLGLDVEARDAVLDMLRVLADEGVAVVIVDHDLAALLPRCDRAALLTEGAVEHHAEPTTLLAQRVDLLPATFLVGASR